MKVLLCSSMVFPSPPQSYGGLEQVVFDLAVCLGQIGHDVYVLCPNGSQASDYHKIITPVDAGLHNLEPAAYEAMKPSLGDFDIIHSHMWSGLPYQYKRERPAAHVLQTLHAPTHLMSRPVEKPCFVTASYAHAGYLSAETDLVCRTVHHGIDLSRYTPGEGKDNYLLYLARVTPEKGALHFVRLCKKVGLPGIIAGPDLFVSDPNYPRAVMEACTDTRGLVQYLGEVSNNEHKVELLGRARCLVSPIVPPYIEIFGLSTIEAMACGTPVLATNFGAARELIVHGKTGAIARDVVCLEENLKTALECAPEACVERAKDFSRERMALEYEKLYQDLLEGRDW